MKAKIYVLLTLFWLTGMNTEAQFLKNLKKRVQDAAEEAVIIKTAEKVGEKTEKTIDTVLSKKEKGERTSNKSNEPLDPGSGNNSDENVNTENLQPWSKYNFVPGDKIIFHDDLIDEENGEFPSRWDLLKGTAENASFQGENIINFKNKTVITPLMDEDEYLPEVFTIEFDAYFDNFRCIMIFVLH